MNAISPNRVAKVLGYALGFTDNATAPSILPQKITIFSPISENIKNSNLKIPIEWNKAITFTNANQVFQTFGMCPAYLISRILKPLSGGGVNTPFDIYPIDETNSLPTEYHLILTGDNQKNVSYNIAVNGRKFNDGKQIEFILETTDTVLQKYNKIINSINSNIYSPMKAELSISPTIGKKIITKDLTPNIDDLLNIENGGVTFITNLASYNVNINTAGTSGNLVTSDLNANLTAILGVASGSFKIQEDGGIPKELEFKNTGEVSTLITTSLFSNYKNFVDIKGIFEIKQDTNINSIELDSSELAAVQTSSEITVAKLSAFKLLNNANFSIQTSEDSLPISITTDLTAINTLDDMINAINSELNNQNSTATAIKGRNSEKIVFYSTKKGSGVTIAVTTTNPTQGIDITTATYLDIAGGYNDHGKDKINITSHQAVINDLDRLNRDLIINNTSNSFGFNSTTDLKEKVIYSNSQDTQEIVLSFISGDNILGSDFLDYNNIYSYINVGAIDDNAKLTNYLNLQARKNDIGPIIFDVSTNKFTFESLTKGITSNISMLAGTTGVDMADNAYFSSNTAIKTNGTDKLKDLSELVQELNNKLISQNAGISITLLSNNQILFENNTELGVSSVLNINNLAGHTGEQLMSSNLLDIANSTEELGREEQDSVLISSKWNGPTSNDLNFNISTDQIADDNTTFTISKIQDGAGSFDISTALSNIGDIWTTIYVNCYGIDTLDVLETFNGEPSAETGGTGRYGAKIFKPFVALTGSNISDPNELLKISEHRALDLTNAIVTAPNTNAFPFEIAGAFAELTSVKYENAPHSDISGDILDDIPPPDRYDIGEMNDSDVRDLLVKGGITTVSMNPTEGKYKIEDYITCRRPSDQLVTAIDYSRVRNLLGIDFNIAYNVKSLEQRFIMNKTLVKDNVTVSVLNTIKTKDIKSLFVNFFENLEKLALIYDQKYSLDSLVVTVGTTNPKRVNIQFGYERTETINILSTMAFASFYFTGV